MQPSQPPADEQRKPGRLAYLDEQGICRAFRQSAQYPGLADWQEVSEQRLNGLGQRLPDGLFARSQ